MPDREKHDPNSQAYTNALLGEMDDKIQVVLEATAPISQMQEDLSGVKEGLERVNVRVDSIEGTLGGWSEHIGLIPVIFEEVGALRKDVELVKEAMKLLDRHDERLNKIEERLSAVEQRVN